MSFFSFFLNYFPCSCFFSCKYIKCTGKKTASSPFLFIDMQWTGRGHPLQVTYHHHSLFIMALGPMKQTNKFSVIVTKNLQSRQQISRFPRPNSLVTVTRELVSESQAFYDKSWSQFYVWNFFIFHSLVCGEAFLVESPQQNGTDIELTNLPNNYT